MTYIKDKWDFRVQVYRTTDCWEATIEPTGMDQTEFEPPVSCSAMDLPTLLEMLVPYMRSQCSADPMLNLVEAWHRDASDSRPLHEALGMTADEYAEWVGRG